MLWVYGHYKYFHSYSAGTDFTRQILTTKVGRGAVRVNVYQQYDVMPHLLALTCCLILNNIAELLMTYCYGRAKLQPPFTYKIRTACRPVQVWG